MKAPKVFELLDKINSTIHENDLDRLSRLQIDLLKDYLRKLYDTLDEIKNTTAPETMAAEPVVKTVLHPNKKVLLAEITEEIDKADKSFGTISTDTALKKESKPPATPAIISKTTINETTPRNASLNEKHKSATNEVHQKLSSRPLKDLIDLNKKFIILNELFKTNTEAYLTAVNHLDGLPNFKDAELYIKSELLVQYQWDEKSQPVRMFVKLVKQKFGEE